MINSVWILAAVLIGAGPQLAVHTGVVEPEVAATVEAAADQRVVRDGHLWLRVPLPSEPEHNLDVRVDVHGSAHGVAARSDGFVFVRLVGKKAPRDLELRVWTRDRWAGRGVVAGWKAQPVRVRMARGAPSPGDLVERTLRALAEDVEARGRIGWWRTAPYHSFAANRLRLLAGEAVGPGQQWRPRRRSDLGDMMSLYTGMTSVEEALQADRGLRLGEEAASARTLPLESIEGVPLKAHPWDRMIRDLGKPPRHAPLAEKVPVDGLYLHFDDLRTAVRLGEEVDEWLTPLSRLVEWRSGDSHLIPRYESQLMIERTGLAKRLGHLAAHEVAFVAGDPFVREGTDLSILFRVRNESLLGAALAGYEASARARHPDLKEEALVIGGQSVRRVFTPDRTVNQYRLHLDGVLYLSNSEAAIRRFVAVQAKEAPALASSGDFRYMRAIYPWSEDSESGFAFVSDAFVAKAVSPRIRILQARRMAALADVSAVGYAELMHGWLEGRAGAGPSSREERRRADEVRVLTKTPLSDWPIDKVTAAEQQAYVEFRDSYQRYWRTFIDPIAVRLERSEDGKRLEADARMLPLIMESEYDELLRLVGSGRVHPPQVSDGVQWTFALGRDAKLRRELDQLGRYAGAGALQFGWLGDWVSVGLGESASVWDLAVVAGVFPRKKGSPHVDDERRGLRILNDLPVWGEVHVRNPFSLVATLTAFRAFVERAAPGIARWVDGPKHREVHTVTIEATFNGRDRMPEPFTIHYAIARDVLVASLDRATLLSRIDAVLDDRAPAAATRPEGVQSHIGFAPVQKGTSWLGRTALGMLEIEALRQRDGALRDLAVMEEGLRVPMTRANALAYLGYEPSSVHGDRISTADRYRPRARAIPVAGSPISRVVERLRKLDMSLAFEGEGDGRGVPGGRNAPLDPTAGVPGGRNAPLDPTAGVRGGRNAPLDPTAGLHARFGWERR